MRVSRLSQLIHGAPVGQPVSTTCRVTAVIRIEDDETGELVPLEFTRVINNNSSHFRIGQDSVSAAEYRSKLEEINVFINSKNFLVYQGKVEEIALKNPKERMQMFEEISESVQFKVTKNFFFIQIFEILNSHFDQSLVIRKPEL